MAAAIDLRPDTQAAHDNSETIPSPMQAAWDAAWAAYQPVGNRWDKEFDQAERMPESPEKEAAFERFYKLHLPAYQLARDELMCVPAPSFAALAEKMGTADPINEDHHDSCLADIRRLVREEEEAI